MSKLKDGRYYIQFRPGNHPTHPTKQREYFGRGPEGKAKFLAFRLKHNLDKKIHTGKYFIDIANQYVDAKKHTLRPGSADTADIHLQKHLIPFFGNTDVINITPARLDEYVALRSTQKWQHGNTTKYGVSQTTIRRELATLHAVLNFAAKRGYITHNPAQYHEKPEEDTEEIQPPTIAEFNSIYLHAVPHLKRFMLLAFYTSARPGPSEILKLKWENVDFINGTIFIRSAKKKGVKTRTVPLHPTLLKNLEAWFQEDLQSKGGAKYIVHYYGNGINCILKAWNTAKRKANCLRKITPYANRHCSITTLLESGGDLKSVSTTAGHSNIKMTTERYQHVSTDLVRETISRLPVVGNTSNTDEGKPTL